MGRILALIRGTNGRESGSYNGIVASSSRWPENRRPRLQHAPNRGEFVGSFCLLPLSLLVFDATFLSSAGLRNRRVSSGLRLSACSSFGRFRFHIAVQLSMLASELPLSVMCAGRARSPIDTLHNRFWSFELRVEVFVVLSVRLPLPSALLPPLQAKYPIQSVSTFLPHRKFPRSSFLAN